MKRQKLCLQKGVKYGKNCLYHGALICQEYYIPRRKSVKVSLSCFPLLSLCCISLFPPPPTYVEEGSVCRRLRLLLLLFLLPSPPLSLSQSQSASDSTSGKKAWKKDRGKRALSLKRALSVATIPKRGDFVVRCAFFFEGKGTCLRIVGEQQ